MIGERIKDFKITGRLGKGGMGEVWVAEQQIVKTEVAIKILLAELSTDQQLVQRFFNEAIAVSKIKHAGIVKIHDVGFHNGSAYLIMERLEGETLTSRIRSARRLPIGQVGDIGRQIASVMAATHAAHITHRDLKPENIFVVQDAEHASGERVKILDFGIAKLGTAIGLTGTGGMMGTPGYMAPEQWADAAKADARADVYSVGCLAFEMCCGRPPFVVSTIPEAYTKHVYEIPPRARMLVPEVPHELDEMIAAALAKQPSDRPSMKELQRAFAAVEATHPGALVSTQSGIRDAVDTVVLHAPAIAPVALVAPTIPVAPAVTTSVGAVAPAVPVAPAVAIGPAVPVAPAVAGPQVVPIEVHTTLRGSEPSPTIEPRARRWRLVAISGVAIVGIGVGGYILTGHERGPSPTLTAEPVSPPHSATTETPAAASPADAAPSSSDARSPDNPKGPYGSDEAASAGAVSADASPEMKAEFYANLGAQQLIAGDAAGAAANFKKALELDGKNVVATTGMGEISLHQGLFGDAIAHLTQAAKLAPGSAKVFTLLGEAYLNSGNKLQAAAQFKKVLQLDPDDARARDGYNKASIRGRASSPMQPATTAPVRPTNNVGKPEPVAPPADKPKADPVKAYRDGLQQYARGDMASALATFRASLSSDPDFAGTWRGLGLVYEKLGYKAQARSAFKRYLQLAPTAGDAEQIKDRMERLGSSPQ